MRFSALMMLLANVVPLVGVSFWGWDLVLVLALFWIENLIIGAFNILRMVCASIYHKKSGGIFLIAFFIVHYGAFCAVHGMLLAGLLGQEISVQETLGIQSEGISGLFLEGAAVFWHFWTTLAPAIWFGVTALMLSKIVSFLENFVVRGGILGADLNKLMTQPYRQIVVMHVGLIGGALLLQKLGSPVWLLAALVLLKMIFDFRQYRIRNQSELAEQVKDF